MLVCQLSDQLGNQMFAYATIKTIALDKGYVFKVMPQLDNQFLKNDTDNKYGNTIISVFSAIQKEVVENLPCGYAVYQEKRNSNSSVLQEVIDVKDNTLMKGHYIAPRYFMHRLSEVQKWFSLPEDIVKKSSTTYQRIKDKYPEGTKFCSVHFRNALDYRVKGFMLSKNYWYKAANKVLEDKGKSTVFIVFYDKKTALVERFIKKFQCETSHNSLFVDFDMIANCDYHIICNSSYSMMSALMDKKSIDNIYCPSVWPIPNGVYAYDTYPDQFIKIKCNRDRLSFCLGKIAPLLSPLKHLIVRK